MKDSITKFDLESAFKALDEIEVPKAEKGIKSNKPALTEIFARKSKFDALMEDYYDISSNEGLEDAKAAEEAEVAKAKLARIEKIVDLEADSPDDLLTSYVGKLIVQCPQCMTLFYKNPEDIVASEDDPTIVNVDEVCQHCGNASGYSLIGKVGAVEEDPDVDLELEDDTAAEETEQEEPEKTEEDTEEPAEEEKSEETEDDLDAKLADLNLEDEADEENKTEEALFITNEGQTLTEGAKELDTEVSADEFEELIKSPEFKKPISDTAVRAMLAMEESVKEPEEEAADSEASEELQEAVNYDKLISEETDAIDSYSDALETSETAEEEDLLTHIQDEEKEHKEELIKAQQGDFETQTNTNNKLEEGIFDKLKGAITGKPVSREEKANWILVNATKNDKQKFKTFVIIGFDGKYNNGKEITVTPSFDNAALVISPKMKKPETRSTFKEAEMLAKGWSQIDGNGPAFIYAAKDPKDKNAVFICQYFKGNLEKDLVDKYYESIKKELEGKDLISQSGGLNQTRRSATTNQEAPTEQQESLDTIFTAVEELQESSLEKMISDSLIEAYENVAGFRIKDCSYLNEQFTINGLIHFTSGKTRKTAYTFTESYLDDNKVILKGLNEKLGGDKTFSIIGHTDNATKTFITEDFKMKVKDK